MIETLLWGYTGWLVVIRMTLPIASVVLRDFAGVDVTNAGIPVASAILSAAVAGRIVARVVGRMPTWRELLAFAIPATLIFCMVNYAVYMILAHTGIGPIQKQHLLDWYQHGHLLGLMVFLTSVAFVSNCVLYPISAMVELKALSRRNQEEHNQ